MQMIRDEQVKRVKRPPKIPKSRPPIKPRNVLSQRNNQVDHLKERYKQV